ncbi:XrtA/PEP-CTERM system TPR-repeat protein PrsT [uncultured Dechloromonas sp.]|uniref:XrtA/PEP-CTERM system TPR-repeat protein PrsT n=1 Tax=uncultured Dechloromonas sp. TaxID=171719 RepID=UPI0025D6295A|nr:XrtA/PEP-CTERM system TPR-repeat protein PrsT [uncultured Dechloromonas sp.]
MKKSLGGGKPMLSLYTMCNEMRSTVIALSCILILGCSNSASDYVKEGAAFLDKGDLAAALISFKNAVQADPKLLAARLALAEALERNGDLPGAEQQLRRALESGGDPNELAPRIAVLLLDRGENALLVRDFGSQKLQSPVADSDLKALVGLAYLASGQSQKASEQLALAKEMTPAIRLASAQLAFSANRRAEAAAEMDDVLRVEHAPWWVARAASRVFLANEDAAKALQAIKRAYDAAPMHRGVVGEYAEQLIGANRKEEARPLRDKLRKLAPGYYRTQYLEALFLLEDGKQDLAYTAATKVLAALPEHIPSQVIAASIELERNELSSVETRIKKILSASPNSSEGFRLKSMLEMRRGNVVEAAFALDKAINRAPEDRGLLAMASGVSWSRGDKQAAIRLMSKAALQEPVRADFLAKLAEMLGASGQQSEALKALDSAKLAAKEAKDREAVFNAALRTKQYGLAKDLAKAEITQRPQDSEPLMWMAAVVGSEGNEAKALELTRQALDLHPDNYAALSALLKTAKTPEARLDYENRLKKAVDVGAKDPRIYLDQVRLMAGAGAEAEKIGALLDKGVAAAPTDLALREAATQHWVKAGRKDRALALVKEGEGAMPDNARMLALAAYVQESVGESSQSSVKFAQLSERYPDRVDWSLKHAQNQIKAGKNQDAEKVLRRLIQLRPEEVVPYQMLARLQVSMKLAKEAQTTAEMLRDKPRQKAVGLILLGDVYGATDRHSDALKAYAEAGLAGLPELAMEKKVRLLDQSGSGTLAAAELTKWLIAHPDNVPGLALAANRASAQGDYKEAAKHLEKIVKKDPNNPVALNDLAWALVMSKDSRALDLASKASSLAPKSANALDTLSQAQLNGNQRGEAIATARKALALDAKSGVVRVHLAEMLVPEGNKVEAKELLNGIDEKLLDREATARLAKLKEAL